MDGTVNAASIATSISMGTSLMAGWFSVFVAMRSRNGAAADRDTIVSILFAIALLLILLDSAAATLIVAAGMAYAGLAKAALLLTASFAVACMVIGLSRGLRSGRPIKTHSA